MTRSVCREHARDIAGVRGVDTFRDSKGTGASDTTKAGLNRYFQNIWFAPGEVSIGRHVAVVGVR